MYLKLETICCAFSLYAVTMDTATLYVTHIQFQIHIHLARVVNVNKHFVYHKQICINNGKMQEYLWILLCNFLMKTDFEKCVQQRAHRTHLGFPTPYRVTFYDEPVILSEQPRAKKLVTHICQRRLKFLKIFSCISTYLLE